MVVHEFLWKIPDVRRVHILIQQIHSLPCAILVRSRHPPPNGRSGPGSSAVALPPPNSVTERSLGSIYVYMSMFTSSPFQGVR